MKKDETRSVNEKGGKEERQNVSNNRCLILSQQVRGGWGPGVLSFISFFVSPPFFSQIVFHIRNYRGTVRIERYTPKGIIQVCILKGKGLYVYGGRRLEAGMYRFRAGDKVVEIPVGAARSFRITADYQSRDIQTSVEISGSSDNVMYQEFLMQDSVRERIEYWSEHHSEVQDPFIRACMEALLPVVVPPGLNGPGIRKYIEKHYFDHIDFSMELLVNTPFLQQRITYFFMRILPGDRDNSGYREEMLKRATEGKVHKVVVGILSRIPQG